MFRIPRLVVFLSAMVCGAFADTYYIDFAGGDNAADGHGLLDVGGDGLPGWFAAVGHEP